jgi:hypothetical protein
MEKIAALVEGHTEHHFVSATYPKVIVQRCLPNGISVDLGLIVSTIRDQSEILQGDIKRVIVLFDREGREMSCKEIASTVAKELATVCSGRTYYIGVSDRVIENWIVADEDQMKQFYGNDEYFYPGDGTNGKKILRDLHGSELAPRDKAVILKSCSARSAKARSQSLGDFIDSIDFDWAWAQS